MTTVQQWTSDFTSLGAATPWKFSILTKHVASTKFHALNMLIYVLFERNKALRRKLIAISLSSMQSLNSCFVDYCCIIRFDTGDSASKARGILLKGKEKSEQGLLM